MDQPNPIRVVAGIVNVLWRTDPPAPHGSESFDSSDLKGPLDALAEGGLPALSQVRPYIDEFLTTAAAVSPDLMSRNEALAFWVNLYNAGAMRLAVEAFEAGENSVLRVPGGFGRRLLTVSGEDLSLDAIEHGKLRRFKDPRIHGALVCGSLSCPTLRSAPYTGVAIDTELDDQMIVFLGSGGAVVDGDTVYLSRVFSWFGRDFVSPQKMPTFLPVRKRSISRALTPWLSPDAVAATEIVFQPYDWALACNIV